MQGIGLGWSRFSRWEVKKWRCVCVERGLRGHSLVVTEEFASESCTRPVRAKHNVTIKSLHSRRAAPARLLTKFLLQSCTFCAVFFHFVPRSYHIVLGTCEEGRCLRLFFVTEVPRWSHLLYARERGLRPSLWLRKHLLKEWLPFKQVLLPSTLFCMRR